VFRNDKDMHGSESMISLITIAVLGTIILALWFMGIGQLKIGGVND